MMITRYTVYFTGPLKRELALVTRERDVLQEAAAFFAKTSR